ncbi:ABC1 family-domain-containing protein [Pavlovales sp. CCMP2436]|nr:ABC1 family-domain-containing protein [Pavlovales sp. CCMP2436]
MLRLLRRPGPQLVALGGAAAWQQRRRLLPRGLLAHASAACRPRQLAFSRAEQHRALAPRAHYGVEQCEAGEMRLGAWSLLARAAYLALMFAPLVLCSPLALLSDVWRCALLRLLVRTLGRCGPCATKLGQWASTRPDVFPRSFCSALAQLHEGVRTHSFEETARTLLCEFGAPVQSLFLSLSERPIGSGCIAQVHEGVLFDGTRVAVKVLHPDATRSCMLDLALIRHAVRLLEAVAPLFLRGVRWLALRGAAEEFEAFMLLQLDLTVEAANLNRFARNFREAPVVFRRSGLGGEDTCLEFPAPVSGLVSRRVLVETLSEGHSLSGLLGAGGGEHSGQHGGQHNGQHSGEEALDEERRRRLARAGLRAFLQMLLVHNFVHADLHPGNILCTFVPGLRGEQITLTFIDAGLTVELSERDRLNFVRLFAALAHGDGRRAGALMLEHAREADCDEPGVFMDKIDALVQQSHASRRGEFTLSRLDVGKVLLDVLSAVRDHRVMIEANYTTLVTSICILEGLGRQLDPDLDLFTLALPILAKQAVSDLLRR